MKKVGILEACSRYQSLRELINPSSLYRECSIRRLSNRCQTSCRNYFSNEFRLKKRIIFDGIVESPYPDIPEIDSDCTLDKFVWERVDDWPNHIAVKKGYRPGQVLSVMLPNSPDYIITLLGAMEAGMIVSPVNPLYTACKSVEENVIDYFSLATYNELSHQLGDNGAVAFVTQPNLVTKLNSAIELIKTTRKTDYKIDAIVTSNSVTSCNPPDAINFEDMISDQIDHSELKPTNRTVEDVAILPYSSGTTGLSKGVQLTHRNCVSNIIQMETPDTFHFYPTTNDHQDVIPGILPFFHIYGLAMIVIRGLRNGVKIVTLPKFEAVPFLSILKDHRATVLYCVPPIILFLGNYPELTNEHVTSLRLILNGAGPISATDVEKVSNRFKSNIIINQAYGLTETSPAVFVASQNENEYSSVGKPLRSTYAKVIKPDGSVAAPKELGEICIKGPQVMSSYFNRPDATKEVIDDEQFFHSGDVGYYDDDGRFYISDRLKELIKVKGFQVPPAELEALLRTHREVTDAAVIGIPDDRTGEKPLAFVVTRSKNAVNERELLEFVSSKVAPYKKLAGVEFVDNIPKSQSGKILRRLLRDKVTSSN